jgi:hypothetical protein
MLILPKISELKDRLDESPKTTFEFQQTTEPEIACPQLLFGLNNHSTKNEILNAVPPRHIVDRLVSKFFNQFEMGPGKCLRVVPVPSRLTPSLVILHRRTFLKQVSTSHTCL